MCKSIVKGWDMKDKMESVVVHGGMSGSKIFKVHLPVITSSSDIVCIRIDVEPDDELENLYFQERSTTLVTWLVE